MSETEFNIEQQLTNQELSDLAAFMQYSAGAPQADQKHNVHTFLHKVATSDDTTKTANLDLNELGMPKLPVRTHKELAVFCEDVADMTYFADYFKKMAEITNATSLSKNGKLIDLAVVNRREMADVTKRPRAEGGWFRKKDKVEGGVQ